MTHFYSQNIKSIMDENVVTLYKSDTVNNAIAMLLKRNLTCLPVVDEERKMLGVINYQTLIDLFLHGTGIERNMNISNVITKDYFVYRENEKLTSYNPRVNEPSFVINEYDQIVGIIHPEQVIKRLMNKKDEWQTAEEIIELYEFCFDTAYEGVAVVDKDGYITLFNEAYSRFTGVNREDAIGKHCTEVIDRTRLPVVLETGIPERNQPHILQGQSMIVNRLPIWKGNKVIGAVGMLMFEGVSEVYDTLIRAKEFFNTDRHRIQIEYPEQPQGIQTFEQIIGESHALGQAKKKARKAARTVATVLLTGESGVGKEIFARSIHHASPVSEGPLITINCAAIPPNLLEAELFGYEDGAFTGARKGGKPGKFELAHKGTIFLDEISEMSIELQAKLLRVLQEQRFERVGGSIEIQVNVRIIAATNQSLEDLVKKGKFREDLYYRLNVIPIEIPPLRDRRHDIPLLVSSFIEEKCQKYNLREIEFSKEAMSALLTYHWPGNVRELANIIERIIVLAENKRIELHNLPTYIIEAEHNKTSMVTSSINEPVSERELLIQTLDQTNGNKSKAARILGIHRSTLYGWLKKYEIDM